MKSLIFFLLVVLSSCSTSKKDKDLIISFYTISDIYYANPNSLEITSESGSTHIKCKNYTDMLQKIDSISADNTSMKHLKFHLDWLIESGYLTASIYPTIDTTCKVTDPIGEVILQYYGPDWAIDATRDIDMQLGSFYLKDTLSLRCSDKVLTWYNISGQD